MYFRVNDTENEQLRERVNAAELSDTDYRNLFYQVWGGCSTSAEAWRIFITVLSKSDELSRNQLKGGKGNDKI